MSAICPCLNTWFHQAPSDPSNPHTNRFCTMCDMAPPMLTMVACIIGIAAALTLHCYWVCIPLAVGTLASGYMIHWANTNRTNKTLHENVSDLYEVNQTLKEFEERLGITTGKDEVTAERLEAVATRLEEKEAFVTQLQQDLSDLKDTAAQFANAKEVMDRQQAIIKALEDAKTQGSEKDTLVSGLAESNRTLAQRLEPVEKLTKAIQDSGIQAHAKHLEQENAKLATATQELGRIEGRIEALQQIEKQLGGHVTQFGQLLTQLSDHKLSMDDFTTQVRQLMSNQNGQK